MSSVSFVFFFHSIQPYFSFPQNGTVNEEIALRWIHIVSGIIWVGLLYFFNLIGVPTMRQLDAPVRGKVFPVLMERAMWWFRWSALVTVLMGLCYFSIILSPDAHNAGKGLRECFAALGKEIAVRSASCLLADDSTPAEPIPAYERQRSVTGPVTGCRSGSPVRRDSR